MGCPYFLSTPIDTHTHSPPEIFTRFSQHFLNIFSTFLNKFSQHFSTHFLNISQHFLNIFSTFSQHFSTFLNTFSTCSQHFSFFSTEFPFWALVTSISQHLLNIDLLKDAPRTCLVIEFGCLAQSAIRMFWNKQHHQEEGVHMCLVYLHHPRAMMLSSLSYTTNTCT